MIDKVEILEDERALQRLCLNHARYADMRDGEGFASLYSSDAILEGPGFRFDTPEAIQQVPDHLRIYKTTYHMVNNKYFDLHGDTAKGVIYSAAHHLKESQTGEILDIVMYLTYYDDYVRQSDGWKFKARKLVLEYLEEKIVTQPTMIPQV